MLGVVERATSLSVGAQSRRGLQAEFEDLATTFREVVEKSELDSVEYLSEEGLAVLFKK